MLALSRFTRATQRRKHKRKHKKKETISFSCTCVFACDYAYAWVERVDQPSQLQ